MSARKQGPEDHSRTVIHVDLDCFYAQVEMLKHPHLRDVPLGIQQKNIVVTSNYKAREFGVTKCMLLSDAKAVCPNLVLANGEDLHDYRQTSYKVTDFMHRFSDLVERLGLDENFIDVTNLVEERLRNGSDKTVVGNIVGDTSEMCQCGCEERLAAGTQIAREIREALCRELGLTSCAGVAHNKLLAKLVCARHKPNQQSVVFPNSTFELMSSLNLVSEVPGIGRSMAEQLQSVNVRTVQDLQDCDVNTLETVVGKDRAKAVKQLSLGIDMTPVKNTGRPQSIGLEDSCKSLTAEKEVKEKLLQLLNRLLLLVEEDGRIPKTVKLTVRKFDKASKASHRETRQCNISPSIFNPMNLSELTPGNLTKIMKIVMTLFSKVININMPYHVTLLGLAFTKFNEKPNIKNSIASFLKQNIEVQSITSIENLDAQKSCASSQLKGGTISSNMLHLNLGTSRSNVEPSVKKLKVNFLAKRKNDSLDEECGASASKPRFAFLPKRRSDSLSEDCASPSKLSVANLHLHTPEKISDKNFNFVCPPDIDASVFQELPLDVQKELWEDYRSRIKNSSNRSQIRKAKPNSLLNYFSKV